MQVHNTQTLLSIGELARAAEVGIETIRFYERERLLAPPARKQSGYRQFETGVVDRLHFIRRAKDLGFSLAEIRELLTLREDPHATAVDVRVRATDKIEQIDEKLRDLKRMRKALIQLTEACHGAGPVERCPIIAALASGKSSQKVPRS